jgi:hypothetical protein
MLYYGHSGISKGIDYLVEAIPDIVKENPDSVLIFNLIPAKRDKEMRERIIDTCRQPLPPTGIPQYCGTNGCEQEGGVCLFS